MRRSVRPLLPSLSVVFLSLACSEKHEPGPQAAAPLVKEATVTWPAAAAADEIALRRFGAEGRARIAKTPLPVLAPAEPFDDLVFVGEDAFYSVNGHRDATLPSGETSRLTVTVHAARRLHVHDDSPADVPTVPLRKTRGLSTVNEDIVTVTWIEGGVAYSVDAECSNVADARCQGDQYVRALTDGLVFVGGAR